METQISQDVIDRVEQAKSQWEAASDAGKRMLIARDIIDRVSSSQIVPSHSWGSIVQQTGYEVDSVQVAIHAGLQCECCALGGMAMSIIGFNNNADFYGQKGSWKSWRNDISPYGCSKVTYDDEHKHLNQNVALNRKLHDLFPAPQLQLIEWCYEQGGGTVQLEQSFLYRNQIRTFIRQIMQIPPTPTWDTHEKPDYTLHPQFSAQSMWDAAIISTSYDNDDDRMIAIMENIIKNNGTFCPDQTPNGQTSPQTAAQVAGH